MIQCFRQQRSLTAMESVAWSRTESPSSYIYRH